MIIKRMWDNVIWGKGRGYMTGGCENAKQCWQFPCVEIDYSARWLYCTHTEKHNSNLYLNSCLKNNGLFTRANTLLKYSCFPTAQWVHKMQDLMQEFHTFHMLYHAHVHRNNSQKTFTYTHLLDISHAYKEQLIWILVLVWEKRGLSKLAHITNFGGNCARKMKKCSWLMLFANIVGNICKIQVMDLNWYGNSTIGKFVWQTTKKWF